MNGNGRFNADSVLSIEDINREWGRIVSSYVLQKIQLENEVRRLRSLLDEAEIKLEDAKRLFKQSQLEKHTQ